MRFEKSCNYPPLHSRALAVQRFKASGLPLPVLVIMYVYLPTHTRTHTHATSARAAAAAVVVLQSYNNSRPPLLQQGVMTFCSESGSSPWSLYYEWTRHVSWFWRIRRRFGFQRFSPGSCWRSWIRKWWKPPDGVRTLDLTQREPMRRWTGPESPCAAEKHASSISCDSLEGRFS